MKGSTLIERGQELANEGIRQFRQSTCPYREVLTCLSQGPAGLAKNAVGGIEMGLGFIQKGLEGRQPGRIIEGSLLVVAGSVLTVVNPFGVACWAVQDMQETKQRGHR